MKKDNRKVKSNTPNLFGVHGGRKRGGCTWEQERMGKLKSERNYFIYLFIYFDL